MSKLDRFPVLHQYRHAERHLYADCPKSIPWDLIAPHEEQAKRNHYQSLARLAERGGLSPLEMWAVLTDQPFPYRSDHDYSEATKVAIDYIKGLVCSAASTNASTA